MLRKTQPLLWFSALVWIFILNITGWALPARQTETGSAKTILIVIVDKLDSLELLNSRLPEIRKFLEAGTWGLMNIRNGSGYTDSTNGYLSLGAGSRSVSPVTLGGALKSSESSEGQKAGSYLKWTFGSTYNVVNDKLIIPEIGLIRNQALGENHPVEPGYLGTIFHQNGWKTFLLGNADNSNIDYRPGGYLLMDGQGLIDGGNIGPTLNEVDNSLPYRYRSNTLEYIKELNRVVAPQRLIGVEFGDFSRLDGYREDLKPSQFSYLKELTWRNFAFFITKINEFAVKNQASLIMVTPSISKDSLITKNYLTVMGIVDPAFSKGWLASGTTNWPGLVANVDLLPTVVKIANLKGEYAFSGRVVTANPVLNPISKLQELNQKLVSANAAQRTLLDWFLGIISGGWLLGMGAWYLRKASISAFLFTGVAVAPLILFLLPLLPSWSWQVNMFIGFTVLVNFALLQIKTVNSRFLVLSGCIWLALIIDQLSGWPLIRFSALGYNAMAGSRYYGLGNELMGIFLAASILFGHLITWKTGRKWPAVVVLTLSLFVLSWPQLGAKFGGIIAGFIGFAFYLAQLSQWKFDYKKVLGILMACGLMIFIVGWWDSLRQPELQTHIGNFFKLFVNQDFAQIGQVLARKLGMNLKLTQFSPWVRISLLVLAMGVFIKLFIKQVMVKQEDRIAWNSILVSSITAYLFNDAGVLACATCLTYGFSFILLKFVDTARLH